MRQHGLLYSSSSSSPPFLLLLPYPPSSSSPFSSFCLPLHLVTITTTPAPTTQTTDRAGSGKRNVLVVPENQSQLLLPHALLEDAGSQTAWSDMPPAYVTLMAVGACARSSFEYWRGKQVCQGESFGSGLLGDWSGSQLPIVVGFWAHCCRLLGVYGPFFVVLFCM